jgi:hypothetical protein
MFHLVIAILKKWIRKQFPLQATVTLKGTVDHLIATHKDLRPTEKCEHQTPESSQILCTVPKSEVSVGTQYTNLYNMRFS